MKFFIYNMLALLLVSSQAAQADSESVRLAGREERLLIVAGHIPGHIESAEKGHFVDIVKEAGRRARIIISIDVFSDRRAKLLFRSGKYDGYMAWTSLDGGNPTLVKPAIWVERGYAFVKAGRRAPTSYAALEGLTVGVSAQYPYSSALTGNKKIRILRDGQSINSSLQMLMRGRIDAYIATERSMAAALRGSDLEGQIVHDAAAPLYKVAAHLVLAPTDSHAKLAERLSLAMESLHADGSAGNLMMSPPQGRAR